MASSRRDEILLGALNSYFSVGITANVPFKIIWKDEGYYVSFEHGAQYDSLAQELRKNVADQVGVPLTEEVKSMSLSGRLNGYTFRLNKEDALKSPPIKNAMGLFSSSTSKPETSSEELPKKMCVIL